MVVSKSYPKVEVLDNNFDAKDHLHGNGDNSHQAQSRSILVSLLSDISKTQDVGSALIEANYTKNISGWNYLSVQSKRIPQSKEDNLRVFYAAGYSEGYLTCNEIKEIYPNFIADNFGESGPPHQLIEFLGANYQWMKRNAEALAGDDDGYWFSVKASLTQLDGLLYGFLSSDCARDNSVTLLDFPLREQMSDQSYLDRNEKSSISALFKSMDSRISMMHLLLLNAWGDIYTIMSKLDLAEKDGSSSETVSTTATNGAGAMDSDELRATPPRILSSRLKFPQTEIDRDLRCSSIFRILPDFSDILFGHTTWGSFIALGPRIFKRYTLPAISPSSSEETSMFELRDISFSSSPALLASLDDFYVINSIPIDMETIEGNSSLSPSVSLAVIETTNSIMNGKLFDLVEYNTSLCWMRAIVANNLAIDGASWSETFGRLHSGTYPNQWQILDINKFIPMVAPQPGSGLFTLFEEIPGLFVYRDATDIFLRSQYWASYNVPFFREISVVSGNAAACALGGKEYCWETSSRANIFRERARSVSTIEDMKSLLQYNDWQADELSLGDPCKAIACRRDLEPRLPLRYPSGGLDGKVSSAVRILESVSRSGWRDIGKGVHSSRGNQGVDTQGRRFLGNGTAEVAVPAAAEVHIRIGPTSDDQEVFCWSQLEKEFVHVGQPDCFDFDWVSVP